MTVAQDCKWFLRPNLGLVTVAPLKSWNPEKRVLEAE